MKKQTKDETPPLATLNELIARYELEPNLCDIYVEGNTDKHLITWFLEKNGYRVGKEQPVRIYDCNDIDISGEELKQRDLLDNNRSRVIAVALEMQKELKVMPKYLSCLVDKDVDWLFRKESPCGEGLLFTDYCDLEMYLFNESVIDKFLHLVLSTSTISATQLLDNLSPVLEELFLIRATNQALQWGMEWFSLEKCSQLKKDNTLQFDEAEFITRYLSKNSKLPDKSRFLEKLAELRSISSNYLPDCRCKIRGHDFIEVLSWYLEKSVNKFKGKVIQPVDSKAIGGSLLGCVELEQLKQEQLFKQLLARVPPLTKDV